LGLLPASVPERCRRRSVMAHATGSSIELLIAFEA
jgi:hypothetical protein